MTATRQHGRCQCPVCTAEAALALIGSGRPQMAALLMRDLPDRIHDAMGAAYAKGHDTAVIAQRRNQATAKPARPEPPAGGSRPRSPSSRPS